MVGVAAVPLVGQLGARSSRLSCASGVAFWSPVEFSTLAALNQTAPKPRVRVAGMTFMGVFHSVFIVLDSDV